MRGVAGVTDPHHSDIRRGCTRQPLKVRRSGLRCGLRPFPSREGAAHTCCADDRAMQSRRGAAHRAGSISRPCTRCRPWGAEYTWRSVGHPRGACCGLPGRIGEVGAKTGHQLDTIRGSAKRGPSTSCCGLPNPGSKTIARPWTHNGRRYCAAAPQPPRRLRAAAYRLDEAWPVSRPVLRAIDSAGMNPGGP